MKYSIIVIAIISGMLAGVASGYYTGKKYAQEIVTVDIKKIAEEKRMELIKRFKSERISTEKTSERTDENEVLQMTKNLEKEYADFLTKLDLILDAYLKGHKNTLLVRKEAIIDGKYTDITEAVKDKANALIKERTEGRTEEKTEGKTEGKAREKTKEDL